MTTSPRRPPDLRGAAVWHSAVLGGTAGLCTNLALLMGVFVAAPSSSFIILTGIAGLLAGACSLAVGAYIAVRSQHDLARYQARQQEQHLATTVTAERALILARYRDYGFPAADAQQLVDLLFQDPARALQLTLREATGIDWRAPGAPFSAALRSFLAFAAGAFLPLFPFLVGSGIGAFAGSLLGSLAILGLLGAIVGRLTHRNLFVTAVCQVTLGGAAALVTFIIGNLVGAVV